MRENLIDDVVTPTAPRRRVRRGQEWGDELDADRYLCRDPNAWDRSVREAQPRRTVTIGCNIVVSWAAKPADLLYRGAAALALADVLTARGYNVGIDLFKVAGEPSSGVTIGMVRYRLKDPTMPLDLPALTFAMCEVAFSRIVGVCGEARHWPGKLAGGFGHPAPIPVADRQGLDYRIDADILGKVAAEAWLRSQLEPQGVSHV
jgi:hypothetical protein